MKEYNIFTSLAFQLLNACEVCGGNALFVQGISTQWICINCGAPMEAEEPEDPLLDVYRETIDKLE